ncbi:MAG: flagellar filament capping protein FliD [Candidatus Schekmanbacteria bacterium]|nr:flagellar filament capping protein FliD [Candidatus Schekmanbacteria bacterium]
MAGMQVSGLITGVDIYSIIDQLVYIEREPIRQLDRQKETYSNRLTALQTLNSRLSALQSAATSLDTNASFRATTATSSNETAISISSDETAGLGTHSIDVTNLAKSHQIRSGTFTSKDTALGMSGSVIISKFENGDMLAGKAINIAATDTLESIADRINNTSAGVSASILSVSDTDHRLIVTSQDTGASYGLALRDASGGDILSAAPPAGLGLTAGAEVRSDNSAYFTSDATALGSLFGLTTPAAGTVQVNGTNVDIDLAVDDLNAIQTKLSAVAGVTANVVSKTINGQTQYRLETTGIATLTDSGNILETIGFLKAGVADEAIAAEDAIMTVDGQPNIQRSTNTVADVLQGVTLNLLQETASTVTVSVNRDLETVKTNVKDFVTKYNDVLSYFSTITDYEKGNLSKGQFFGDASIQGLQGKFREEVLTSVDTGGTYSLLSSVGITFDDDGNLEVDDAKLSAALANDFQSVEELFRGETDGLSSRLDSRIDSLLDSVDGTMTIKAKSLNTTISNYDDEMARLEDSVAQRQEALTRRFLAMEKAVTNMRGQMNSLLAVLGSGGFGF